MGSAVLVAELEPETREYLGRQLRDDGFDVLGAARRNEALDRAERARPDLRAPSPSSRPVCAGGRVSPDGAGTGMCRLVRTNRTP
jgi:CheY-like chemotaxis protein